MTTKRESANSFILPHDEAMETETVVNLFCESISRGGARGTQAPSHLILRPN